MSSCLSAECERDGPGGAADADWSAPGDGPKPMTEDYEVADDSSLTGYLKPKARARREVDRQAEEHYGRSTNMAKPPEKPSRCHGWAKPPRRCTNVVLARRLPDRHARIFAPVLAVAAISFRSAQGRFNPCALLGTDHQLRRQQATTLADFATRFAAASAIPAVRSCCSHS